MNFNNVFYGMTLRIDHCLPIQNLINRFAINLVFYSIIIALYLKNSFLFKLKSLHL